MDKQTVESTAVWDARLSERQISDMFICMMRYPAVRESAFAALRTDLFVKGETHFIILFKCMEEIYKQRLDFVYRQVINSFWNKLPAYESEISEADIAYIAAETQPYGIVFEAFKIPDTGDTSPTTGNELLRRFIRERAVFDPIRLALDNALLPNDYITNVGAVVDRVRIDEMHADRIGRSRKIDFSFEAVQPVYRAGYSTGVDFFDYLTGGGPGDGEVALVLAPSGVGKTTLAVHMCMNYSLAQSGMPIVEHRRHSALFSYEDGKKLIMPRVVAAACGIDRSRYERARNITELTTTATMLPYEREKRYSVGEQERLATFLPPFLDYMALHDFSESGFGGVREIISELHGMAGAGQRPGLVVLDWAGQMIGRYVSAMSHVKDAQREITSQLNGLVDILRTQIAIPFNTPVVVFHQLRGALNKQGPMAHLGHSDGANATSMGVNSDFCIVANAPDPKTYISRWVTTKGRRDQLLGEQTLVRLDGRFAKFERVDGTYMIDSSTNTVVPRSAAADFRPDPGAGVQRAMQTRQTRSVNERPPFGGV